MEPKPLVVGIAWVVECAEKRVRADETPFLVNLDNVNVAGGHKVSCYSATLYTGVDRIIASTFRPPQVHDGPWRSGTVYRRGG